MKTGKKCEMSSSINFMSWTLIIKLKARVKQKMT